MLALGLVLPLAITFSISLKHFHSELEEICKHSYADAHTYEYICLMHIFAHTYIYIHMLYLYGGVYLRRCAHDCVRVFSLVIFV